jgi:1,4-alpha-glucan branching enzyme
MRLFRPDAGQVFVAGTFNAWAPDATPLNRDGAGMWAVALSLAPGTYEYRFIVDGRWEDDPQAARVEANPFGSSNAVLEVPPE